MMLIGIALIAAGCLFLVLGLYQKNPVQGAVSESSPVFALFFGLLDWKRNKGPLIVIAVGVVVIAADLLL